MIEGQIFYDKDYDQVEHPYKVVFFNESGEKLVKGFSSPFNVKKFVNKLRHSRKCELVSFPSFA